MHYQQRLEEIHEYFNSRRLFVPLAQSDVAAVLKDIQIALEPRLWRLEKALPNGPQSSTVNSLTAYALGYIAALAGIELPAATTRVRDFAVFYERLVETIFDPIFEQIPVRIPVEPLVEQATEAEPIESSPPPIEEHRPYLAAPNEQRRPEPGRDFIGTLDGDELIPIAEAAAMVGMSLRNLYRYINAGVVPSLRLDGRTWVSRSWLELNAKSFRYPRGPKGWQQFGSEKF